METPAIYKITNSNCGKCYIGSSKNAEKRLSIHKWKLTRGKHDNIMLQRAWDRDEEASFVFEILEPCSIEDLLKREQFWIDTLRSASVEHGYNLCPVAGTRAGTRQPESVREKMRGFHAGKPKSAEHRAKISAAALGRKKSDEHREKLKQAAILQFSDGDARKRAAEYGRMAEGFRGKAHTEAVKAGLRAKAILRGLVLSDEQVIEIRIMKAGGATYANLATMFGVSVTTLTCLVRGKTYTHVA